MYFITCFDENWIQNKRWMSGVERAPRDTEGRVQYLKESRRTFGYYPDKAEAVEAVLQNRCDLHETVYTFCVIEHIPAGIHASGDPSEQVWFRWKFTEEPQGGHWETIERPKETRRSINFSIG